MRLLRSRTKIMHKPAFDLQKAMSQTTHIFGDLASRLEIETWRNELYEPTSLFHAVEVTLWKQNSHGRIRQHDDTKT